MLHTVANWLRNKLRAWLQVPAESTTVVVEKAQREGISIAAATLALAGERSHVHRKVEAPKLPAGVVPDGFAYDASNDPGGLGPFVALDSALVAPVYAYANEFHSGLGFPGYAYLAELSQRSEYREPAATLAAEMTREFITITTKAHSTKAGKPENKLDKPENEQNLATDAAPPIERPKPGTQPASEALDDPKGKELEIKVERLKEALEEFKVREHFRKLAEVDGLFGRAQLFIDIDGHDERTRQLPLVVDKATIKKGSLRGFKVIEPIWTTPYTYNATDPTAADFYVPRAWFVMGKRIHASRLLTFISREVPDILKPAYNFSGLSLTQLMEPYVFQWLRTRNSVSDLVHNFSVMCLKTNMQNILSGEADKPGGVLDRAKLFVETRDNRGLTLLDKNDEDLVAVNVPLSGLDKLQAQAQEHMSAPAHIPLVKLIGVTPSGLNASSEGEIQVWYDYVRSEQQSFFGPHLKTVIEILQLHLFGEIDDAISFEFVPLHSPTAKEAAEIRKINAETDAVLIDKGVVSPDEARVRVATSPDSGYNNLSGDAPPLPDMLGAEHGFGLNEEAAQNAHERNLEAQEAANKTKEKDAA
jgi:phage-related protein (TIGR01555 family)